MSKLDNEKKIAIVIGATGVVGREIVSQLASLDNIEQVLSLTRREVPYENQKIQNHIVDFERLEEFSNLFKGDFLFSALGTTLKQAGSIESQRRVDLDYQYRAAKIASEQGVSHYLLVSSSGANSQSRSAYLQMKGELEERVQKLSFKRITIVRPSLLLGERDDFRLGEIIGSKILPALCHLPGLKKYRPITGGEVASAMISCSQSSGQEFEVKSLDELFV